MGARRYGDIATLVAMARPEVGILTNVGEAHLEIMGTRERLAETKWALFAGGARAVLNAADAVSVARAPALARRRIGFSPGTATAPGFSDANGLRVAWPDAPGRRRRRPPHVRRPGRRRRSRRAQPRQRRAAIAGALELGVDLAAMAAVLPELRLPPGRFESFEMSGGWRIIYDAYNANASG